MQAPSCDQLTSICLHLVPYKSARRTCGSCGTRDVLNLEVTLISSLLMMCNLHVRAQSCAFVSDATEIGRIRRSDEVTIAAPAN